MARGSQTPQQQHKQQHTHSKEAQHAGVDCSRAHIWPLPRRETIKKAQQVGVKVKELQEELQQTEIEAVAAEGGCTVTVTGSQVLF